jgi:hypothetical protein
VRKQRNPTPLVAKAQDVRQSGRRRRYADSSKYCARQNSAIAATSGAETRISPVP